MAFALFAEAVEPVMRLIDADADGDAIAAFLAERAEALEVGLTDAPVHVVGALRERVDIYRIVEAVLAGGRLQYGRTRPKAAWPSRAVSAFMPSPGAMEPVEANSCPVTVIFVEGDGLAERRPRLEALGLDILSLPHGTDRVASAPQRRDPWPPGGRALHLQAASGRLRCAAGAASGRPTGHCHRPPAPLRSAATSSECWRNFWIRSGPPGAEEAEHDQILGELSLNLVNHPRAASGGCASTSAADGTHVSGVVRAGLQREGRPAWVVHSSPTPKQGGRGGGRHPAGRLVFDLRLFETQSSRPLVPNRRAILAFDQVAW